MTSYRNNRQAWGVTALGCSITVIVAATLGVTAHYQTSPHPAVAVGGFLAQLAALVLILLGLGWRITGVGLGAILSSRYTYSLSKLQMAGWTCVVFAALLVAAEIRLFGFFGAIKGEALSFSIPGELMAAMGIALFTTGATPAVLALKAAQNAPPDPQADQAARRMAEMAGTDTATIDNVGRVMTRSDKRGARLIDLVTGDEVANAGNVDLSKVQNLLLTMLLLGAYTGMVIARLAGGSNFDTGLPALDERFVELMAVSHAGYLAYKALPKPVSGAADPSRSPPEMRAPQAAAPPPRR